MEIIIDRGSSRYMRFLPEASIESESTFVTFRIFTFWTRPKVPFPAMPSFRNIIRTQQFSLNSCDETSCQILENLAKFFNLSQILVYYSPCKNFCNFSCLIFHLHIKTFVYFSQQIVSHRSFCSSKTTFYDDCCQYFPDDVVEAGHLCLTDQQ